MRKIETTKRFHKDMKKMKARGKSAVKLQVVLDYLINAKALPTRYRAHRLVGNW